MMSSIKQVVLVFRAPDQVAPEDNSFLEGDIVEVETDGGWVLEVDPITRETLETRQCFRVGYGAQLHPVRRGSWLVSDDRLAQADARRRRRAERRLELVH